MVSTMEQAGTDPKIRQIAERLLAYEAVAQKPSGANTSTGSRVCQKLGHPLIRLIGTEGYRAILTRALALARREAEALNAVRVKNDGSVEYLNGEAEKISVVLISHVIGLVVTFLGESLTAQLVVDVWPEQTAFDKDFSIRNGHERTK